MYLKKASGEKKTYTETTFREAVSGVQVQVQELKRREETVARSVQPVESCRSSPWRFLVVRVTFVDRELLGNDGDERERKAQRKKHSSSA